MSNPEKSAMAPCLADCDGQAERAGLALLLVFDGRGLAEGELGALGA